MGDSVLKSTASLPGYQKGIVINQKIWSKVYSLDKLKWNPSSEIFPLDGELDMESEMKLTF